MESLHRLRIRSLDKDDSLSGHFCGPRNSYNSALNSDSDYSGSISVRDMIRHYDSNWNSSNSLHHITSVARRRSHHSLLARKPSHCGLGSVASPTHISLLDAPKNGNNITTSISCCKNCTACMCCQNRSRTNCAAIKALQSHDSDANPNVEDVVVVGNTLPRQKSLEFKDNFDAQRPLNARNVMEKNRLPSTDSIEEAKCHSIETSYQSKTTIAKTASGVRIIIDIFFDQEQCVNAPDVLGSRVETDIPQSRILSEFQQQAQANAATTTSASASASGSTTTTRNCSYLP